MALIKSGAPNQVQKGGVCTTHGARVTRKGCSFEGCTNRVVQGGVCVTHGAQKKRCTFRRCNNQVVKREEFVSGTAQRLKQCTLKDVRS